ncbi:MAG: CsgG/HfaB family protein [Gemmatimonadaceae bacterium]
MLTNRWPTTAAAIAGCILLASCARQQSVDTHQDKRFQASRAEADEAARAAIAGERSLSANRPSEGTVAVAPFDASSLDSNTSALGFGVADLLITDLAVSSRLRVVDRIRIDAVLRELNLANSGRMDSATAPRLGRLVAARQIISGRLTRLDGDEIRIGARLLDVDITATYGRSVGTNTNLSRILDAEKELAFMLIDELGISLTPAERAILVQRPTRDIGAFLAYSRGVRDEAGGRFESAAAEYGQALSLDPGFTNAASRLRGVEVQVRPMSSARANTPARGAHSSLRGVIDGVNPSPASRLGRLRSRGHDNANAALEAAIGTIVIFVYTIP